MPMLTPVLSILLRQINSSVKKGNAYDIAKALLDHYHEIPELTIHELADACYISASSLSRFIRTIGFEQYTDFKKACKKNIGIDVDYSKDMVKAKAEDMRPILERYTESIKQNIEYTYQQMNFEQLDKLCTMIFEAKEIAFFGLEFATLLGQHFQIKMASMNKFIRLGLSYEEQIDIARDLHDGALIFVASLEGGYFYRNDEVVDILKQKDTKIVALTMNEHTKLMKNVDEILICSKDNSNTEGRITLLYMLEILLMYYYVNYQALSI